jgi:hypothetical protein
MVLSVVLIGWAGLPGFPFPGLFLLSGTHGLFIGLQSFSLSVFKTLVWLSRHRHSFALV